MALANLQKELKLLSHPERAEGSKRFFKTGKGEYGEGDVFIGISVPDSRKIALKYSNLSLSELKCLLESKIHEERLIALLILVEKYNKNLGEKKEIFNFYLDNLRFVNNWDLVDLSADKIVGKFLLENKERYSLLSNRLVKSSNLWERRVAVILTFAFIKANRFNETFEIVEKLLGDKHDLIHKACGWMLREVGKRDEKILEVFLKKHYRNMPRTMLRYAIERFPENKRKAYLSWKI